MSQHIQIPVSVASEQFLLIQCVIKETLQSLQAHTFYCFSSLSIRHIFLVSKLHLLQGSSFPLVCPLGACWADHFSQHWQLCSPWANTPLVHSGGAPAPWPCSFPFFQLLPGQQHPLRCKACGKPDLRPSPNFFTELLPSQLYLLEPCASLFP